MSTQPPVGSPTPRPFINLINLTDAPTQYRSFAPSQSTSPTMLSTKFIPPTANPTSMRVRVFPTRPPTMSPTTNENAGTNGLEAGAIAGMVIMGVVVLGLFGVAAFFAIQTRAKKRSQNLGNLRGLRSEQTLPMEPNALRFNHLPSVGGRDTYENVNEDDDKLNHDGVQNDAYYDASAPPTERIRDYYEGEAKMGERLPPTPATTDEFGRSTSGEFGFDRERSRTLFLEEAANKDSTNYVGHVESPSFTNDLTYDNAAFMKDNTNTAPNAKSVSAERKRAATSIETGASKRNLRANYWANLQSGNVPTTASKSGVEGKVSNKVSNPYINDGAHTLKQRNATVYEQPPQPLSHNERAYANGNDSLHSRPVDHPYVNGSVAPQVEVAAFGFEQNDFYEDPNDQEEGSLYESVMREVMPPSAPNYDYVSTVKSIKGLILSDISMDPKKIKVGKEIGRGEYGRVYVGHFIDGSKREVAIKIASKKESNEGLEDEAAIMATFNSPYIVALIGTFAVKGCLRLCLEYCSQGSLQDILEKARASEHTTKSFGFMTLVAYTIDVASAMVYLSKLQFIHRDLATRNVLVDSENRAKVADFGLSKRLDGPEDHYSMKTDRALPYRWLAPEVLSNFKFTTATDVWSFGITGWEIASLGGFPYDGIDDATLLKMLKNGVRLTKPNGCPVAWFKVIQSCWDIAPEERPTFVEIHHKLLFVASTMTEEDIEDDEPPTSSELDPELSSFDVSRQDAEKLLRDVLKKHSGENWFLTRPKNEKVHILSYVAGELGIMNHVELRKNASGFYRTSKGTVDLGKKVSSAVKSFTTILNKKYGTTFVGLRTLEEYQTETNAYGSVKAAKRSAYGSNLVAHA
eukprot:m.157406 g.157406  ORF g.157406 m.157406 type:complete len:860 (-) comp31055_c0_seq1:371-2950(-)